MAKNTKTTKTKDEELTQESGEQQVQSDTDKAIEQGYIGEKVDPEPNSTYTGPQSKG